ncbi:RND transporter [Shewanella olleyana]|uniref:efflux RND transporter permease subunit n=1 Tax=Shewanella olleyana TaxID=135626 RepID=UPI00200BA25E|nr:RND transporter [Shewanella olleyana]MCL1068741.1 RND transporter [Shewanella olleyana]
MNWQMTLINRSQKHPLWVCFAVSLMVILSLLGVTRISLGVNFNDYFAHDDAGFIGYQQLNSKFEQRNNLLLLLENQQDWRKPKQQARLLQFIEQLQGSDDIANVGGYASFISAANLPATNLPATKISGAKTEHSNLHSPVNRSAFLLSYKQHPRLPLVISESGLAILLNISFSEADKHTFANNTLWQETKIENLLDRAKTYWPSGVNVIDKEASDNLVEQKPIEKSPVNIYLSGEQALNWQYAKVLRHDLSWFAPSLLLVITLMAALFIRARIWLLAIGLNCLVTLIFTLGIAGWFNLTIAAISAFIPVIIITLSLAYSAHLYLAWQRAVHQCELEPLKFSFEHNKLPLFYATLTTMLGFGLLCFSPSPPIQSFGALVAVAVLCHYLLCHSLTVIVINYGRNKKATNKINNGINNKQSSVAANTYFSAEPIARVAIKYPKSLLLMVAVISALASFSVTKLELNDDPLSYFPEDNPFSQSKQKMQQYFDGVNLIHYEVSTEPHQIYDKAYLAFLYQFGRFLKQQPEVNKVTHIGDWVKSAGLTQSQFKQVISQNSVQKLGLGGEVSADYQSSLLSIYLTPLTAKQMIEFEDRVSSWLDDNHLDLMVSPALGSNLLFAHLSIENAKNMLWSFVVALLILSIIIGGIKRSLVFALIGLMVNFLPLLWVFGAWQIMGGYISIGSAVVLGIMLGIIVDDTLHLLLKLPQPNKANSFISFWPKYATIIPVISFTSLTLVLGFGIGLASDFAPIAQLSMLSCLVISLAWLFDVLVLPVIYHQWRRFFMNANKNPNTSTNISHKNESQYEH